MLSSTKPSLQGRFTLVWSRDPALKPRPEDATEAEQWDLDLANATESGDWSAVVRSGETPSYFRCEMPRGVERRRLLDELMCDLEAKHRASGVALAFRACVKEITNWRAIEIVYDPALKMDMLSTEMISMLDDLEPNIVAEIGSEILMRLTRRLAGK